MSSSSCNESRSEVYHLQAWLSQPLRSHPLPLMGMEATPERDLGSHLFKMASVCLVPG